MSTHIRFGGTIDSVGHGGVYELVVDDGTDTPVKRHSRLPDFRGDVHTIVGGQAPLSWRSTGRVELSDGSTFYPSVFSLRWKLAEG